ncbi:MAG TPA: fibronectin type III domain-containing protein [Candidatus Limnocylindrales bacterium]|nr:fibronectin type III domain-containing protein [Candidatus Limnocylindrales bacterium]
MRTISEQEAGRTDVALGLSSRIMGLARVLGGILFFALLHSPVQTLSARCLVDVRRILRRGVLVEVLLHGLMAATSPSVFGAQSVTLAWSPVTNADLAGYNVYYGPASHTYTNITSVGNVTNATISGLVEGGTYYFAATALSTAGLESGYSAEVSYSVTTTLPAVQLQVTPAKQFILTITGTIGHTYNIQASQNLITWTVIGSVTVGAGGSSNFTDTNAVSFSKRFYRIQG